MNPNEQIDAKPRRAPYLPSANAGFGYTLFASAAGKILKEKDLSRVLQTICEEACRVLGADRSLVAKIEGDENPRRRVLSSHDVPQDYIDALEASQSKSIVHDVLREKRLKVFSHIHNESKVFDPETVRRHGLQVTCAIPLLVKKEPFGALVLYHLTPREYTQEDKQFAEAFGNFASIAIEKARLVDLLEIGVEEQKSIHRALKQITSSQDVNEIIQAVLAESEQVMGTERCGVMLPDERTGKLRLFQSQGISPRFRERLASLPEPFPIGQAFLSDPKMKEPIVVPDATADPTFGPIQSSEGHQSIAAFPLRLNERNIGSLFYFWTSPKDIDDHLLFLGKAFADQVAVIIEKTKLAQKSEKRAARLEIVDQIAKAVGSTLEPEDLFRTIVQEIRMVVPCERCVIGTFDPGSGKNHYWYIESGMEISNLSIRDSNKFFWHKEVIEEHSSVYFPDLRKIQTPRADELASAGLRSYLIVPILQANRYQAHISLYRSEVDKFSEDERELLTAIASHLGPAIRNASLFKAAEDRARRLSVLNELNQKISENLDLSEVLARMAQAAANLIGADHVRIFLLDKDSFQLKLRASAGGVPGPEMAQNSFRPGEGFSGSVFQDKQPIIISDIQNDSRFINAKWAKDEGLRAFISLPIIKGQECVGIISCLSKIAGIFDEDTLDLLGALGSQASVAIENARLFSEAKLRADRLAEAQRMAQIGNWEWDVQTNKSIWSKEVYRIFGLSQEETVPSRDLFLNCVHPEDREIVIKAGEKALHENKPYSFDVRILLPNGEERFIHVEAEVIIGEKGNPVRLVGTVQNVTEQKKAEEKILLALAEAEAASQAKSEFLSTMSHELRSPLNAVIGFSELIMRDAKEKDEMTLQLVPKIKESGKYLLALIEDILDLDRIETGKMELKVELTSINDLVSGVVSAWLARLPEQFSLSLEVDPACRMIPCDSTRIGQILNNLIDNAVKYSPEGGTISVQTQGRGDEVWVSVRDEGMGISPEAREAIFERFHQIEKGFTRRSGGLGIGLALARELMEMHGGRIWVESEEGCGSTFYLAFPRIQASGADASANKNGNCTLAGNGEPWEGRTILIVDDGEQYHEYMELLMRSAARLESAYNGLEAIEAARRENPDLILMDLRMPVLDGFDAIERLKFDPATKGIPIIAVTAQAMEEDRVRAFQLGANGFVTKPVDIEAFKSEVGRILGVLI